MGQVVSQGWTVQASELTRRGPEAPREPEARREPAARRPAARASGSGARAGCWWSPVAIVLPAMTRLAIPQCADEINALIQPPGPAPQVRDLPGVGQVSIQSADSHGQDRGPAGGAGGAQPGRLTARAGAQMVRAVSHPGRRAGAPGYARRLHCGPTDSQAVSQLASLRRSSSRRIRARTKPRSTARAVTAATATATTRPLT